MGVCTTVCDFVSQEWGSTLISTSSSDLVHTLSLCSLCVLGLDKVLCELRWHMHTLMYIEHPLIVCIYLCQ